MLKWSVFDRSRCAPARSGVAEGPDPDPDYIHRHVLRTMLSQYDGDELAPSVERDQQIVKSYSYNVDPDWIEENCNIIAFVHLSGSTKEVLQVVEIHLTD